MSKKLPGSRFRFVLSILTISLLAAGAWILLEQGIEAGPGRDSGTLEKMIVAEGSLTMDVDLNRLNGNGSRPQRSELRFAAERDAFFTILVFNDEFRGSLPSAMPLVPQHPASLPAKLNDSYGRLALESLEWGHEFDLVVRDSQTGFAFFNIDGPEFEYARNGRTLNLRGGRVLISKEFAAEMGRPADAGAIIGNISFSVRMRVIERSEVVYGETTSSVLPADDSPQPGTVPGPDVVVGDLNGLAQFGTQNGTQVGLAVGTDSCNFGTVDLNWFANPANDHPVIPQNLYRMSGGAGNNERFEQIGQSNVKHAFTALTQNLCNLGCNGVGGSRLGSGCSDPYSASLNAGPSLGSRAWINPFTGFFPRNDSATPNNSHSGHSHVGPSHRILTEVNDLNTSMNPGATYYAEAQYVTPHEYAHCQANPGQCNMYNNVSYRRYNVSGTASPFGFSAAASTVRIARAVSAWTGATLVNIHPAPGVDGTGIVAYKVTNPSAGVWHYEYAVYNENLDRAIQSFSMPIGGGVTLNNIGFHAPPQHPGWSGDGTVGNTGFSNAPWVAAQGGGSLAWSTDAFALNQNANAIRWGTMYNFRFDSNRPPMTANATVGFYKTGSPITVQVQVPTAATGPFTISGRVLTSAGGRGVYPARVTLTDSSGNIRYTSTNSFGYYRFFDVAGGSTYTVAANSKFYSFAPQMLVVNDNLANVDFIANP